MNSDAEAEIRSFIYAKINHKNFGDLFKDKVKQYGERAPDKVYTACRLLHEIVSENTFHRVATQTNRF